MAPFSDYAADIQALELDDDYRADLPEILSWDIVPTRCMSPGTLRLLGLERRRGSSEDDGSLGDFVEDLSSEDISRAGS